VRGQEVAMTSMTRLTNEYLQHTADVVLAELATNDEFCREFFRNPERTLQLAPEWGVPISPSEISALRRLGDRLWDWLSDELMARPVATA
jgi:hypothetical protein